MPHLDSAIESFDSQECSELPSHAWNEARLSAYATAIHAEIVEKELPLAPAYWRLGMALDLMRKKYPRGTWAAQLGALGVDKTRACKARKIFKNFRSEAELANLTVDQAYWAASTEKMRPRTGRSKSTKKPGISTVLRMLQQELVARRSEVVKASEKKAGALLVLLATVQQEAANLQKILQDQVALPKGTKPRRQPVKLADLPSRDSALAIRPQPEKLDTA
jgi:hypothetical protein